MLDHLIFTEHEYCWHYNLRNENASLKAELQEERLSNTVRLQRREVPPGKKGEYP